MMLSLLLTAQPAQFNSTTGKVELSQEQAIKIANIIQERDLLRQQLKDLDNQLADCEGALNETLVTYDATLTQISELNALQLARVNELQAINESQLAYYKRKSQGLSLMVTASSQVYNFNDTTATSPADISAALSYRLDRWSIAAIPFASYLQFPSGDGNLVSGVKLGLSYRVF